jgi:hypothetical protein
MHEDLFEGGFFDAHITHLECAKLLQYGVDITLEKEMH